MCRQTPHRRCRSSFARKYLSGDPVKAKCGAPIEVQVIDQVTGETVPGSQLANLQLEVRGTSRCWLSSWCDLHAAKPAYQVLSCALEGLEHLAKPRAPHPCWLAWSGHAVAETSACYYIDKVLKYRLLGLADGLHSDDILADTRAFSHVSSICLH